MKIVPEAPRDKRGFAPQRRREYFANQVTAIDAKRFPILARHSNCLLVIDGELAVNDHGCVPKAVRSE